MAGPLDAARDALSAIADRAVRSLVEHPDLFTKLLEISTGARQEGELTLADMARLLV